MKWFKHDLTCRDQDQMWEFIEKHGLTGYGFWWVMVEECYKAESSGFQVSATDTWMKRLSKQLNISDWLTLSRLLDTASDLGLISPQLWAERVIYVPSIVQSGDIYVAKRAQETERKREYRAKQRRQNKEKSKCPTGTKGQKGDLSLSDPDPDPDPDLSLPTLSQKKEGEREDPFFGKQRQPIAVSVTQIFQGPWGTGRTEKLDEFEAKLIREAKSKNYRDPSAYAFKVIDSIAKGGPAGKWRELMETKESGNSPSKEKTIEWSAEESSRQLQEELRLMSEGRS